MSIVLTRNILTNSRLSIVLKRYILTSSRSSIVLKREHTDEVKFCFISLAPSVGIDRLSINKQLNSLLTKFLRTNRLNHNCIARPGGDGSTNPSTNSECVRIEETK